jgi:myo-inositol 2-dehydrogenase/D-chiro-inositol 1-dehydrogenase
MNKPTSPKAGSVTRRDFLQTTSLATGAALLGGLSVERAAHAAGSDTIKLALVGCGGRGSGAAAQALSTEGSVKLIAMADAFKDRLDNGHKEISAAMSKNGKADSVEVPDDNKFIGFDGYKHAIALADVVILATPPGFRPIHFEEAVKQGKNIFTEKPVAVDGAGVRRFLAAADEAKKKNLKVGVGLQRHHQFGYIEAMKRIHDGGIGDILAARCYWNDAGVWVKERQPNQTEMEYQMRNWYYFVWLGGDHIVEQHIHNLDVINWAKNGYPIRCHGIGGRQVRTGKQYGEIFDHHAVEFEYEDGSRCFSQCQHTRGCWSAVTEHLIGSKGRADLKDGEWHVGGADPYNQRGNIKGNAPYQQEHNDLFDAIRNDKPYNEAYNGAMSTLTAIMGRTATYTGLLVERDAVLNSQHALVPDKYDWNGTPPTLPDANGFYPVAVPGSTSIV